MLRKKGDAGSSLKVWATYIDEFFANGDKVLVVVWHETQRTAAMCYIKSALQRFSFGDAVCEVTGDTSLTTGQSKNGRRVIRYHFVSGSSGGGGGG